MQRKMRASNQLSLNVTNFDALSRTVKYQFWSYSIEDTDTCTSVRPQLEHIHVAAILGPHHIWSRPSRLRELQLS